MKYCWNSGPRPISTGDLVWWCLAGQVVDINMKHGCRYISEFRTCSKILTMKLEIETWTKILTIKVCGAGPKGGNMTSVEFYDAKTGAWLTLPRFQIVGFFRLYRVRRSQYFSDSQPFFYLFGMLDSFVWFVRRCQHFSNCQPFLACWNVGFFCLYRQKKSTF